MRILHVTDFHFHKAFYGWLEEAAQGYDLVCFTGDFLERYAGVSLPLLAQADWIEGWLKHFPSPLIGCLGDHDRAIRGPGGPISILRGGDSISVLDHNFLCWPWKPCSDLPEGPLIVLSHEPPAGIFVAQSEEEGDIGDPQLSAEITRLPRGSLILSGHNHEPRRWYLETRGTWCLNPGCNLDAIIPNHIAIDTTTRTATFRAPGFTPPPVRLYHPDSA